MDIACFGSTIDVCPLAVKAKVDLRGLSYRTLLRLIDKLPNFRCDSGDVSCVPAGMTAMCTQEGLLGGHGEHKGEADCSVSFVPVIPRLELDSESQFWYKRYLGGAVTEFEVGPWELWEM
ncbi:hypothetical protein EDB83DRAFT_2321484 [Lactarius deliciosus]|nr:hypothetical protein EDB83DRAFT_2321484 [Lactarius deliciosus]